MPAHRIPTGRIPTGRRLRGPGASRAVRRVLVIAAIVSLGGCTGDGDVVRTDREALASLRDQRSQLLRQFGNLQARIRRTQATALLDPGVRAAQEEFYTAIREFAARGEPGDSALLDRALEIGTDLTRLSTPAIRTPDDPGPAPSTAEERAAVARELAETERRLRPFVDRALADPVVRTAFAALRDTLTGTMIATDPGTAKTLDRLADVAGRIAELDRAIAAGGGASTD
ncbi:MAG: hypothetical protein RRA92_04875 [Gemmatimonadota bacterium]|nr:hypothetical protein [Gemmatimonadota bacterium]